MYVRICVQTHVRVHSCSSSLRTLALHKMGLSPGSAQPPLPFSLHPGRTDVPPPPCTGHGSAGDHACTHTFPENAPGAWGESFPGDFYGQKGSLGTVGTAWVRCLPGVELGHSLPTNAAAFNPFPRLPLLSEVRWAENQEPLEN